MIKNHRIIFLQTLPWNWTADFQKQTVNILSKNNSVVVYSVNSQKSVLELIISLFKKKNLLNSSQTKIVFHNHINFFPSKRYYLLKKINSWLNFLYLFIKYKPHLLWTSDPRALIPYKLTKFFKKNKILYDCSDYHWHPDPYEDCLIKTQEKHLINNSDFFIVNSHALEKLHKKIKSPDLVAPQGFALNDFCNSKLSVNTNNINKSPVLGFIGGINYRLDIPLLTNLINRNPSWQFVFIGPKQQNQIPEDEKKIEKLNQLFKKSNVDYIGNIPKEEIGKYIQSFDIGIIPYDLSYKFNLYCYPMKLFEYFYLGKPIISTPIKELKKFKQYVSVGSNCLEWEMAIKKILKAGWSKNSMLEQKEIAISNSWTNKLNKISKIIYERKTK